MIMMIMTGASSTGDNNNNNDYDNDDNDVIYREIGGGRTGDNNKFYKVRKTLDARARCTR